MSQIKLTQIKKSFFKSKTDTASLWYVFRCNLFLIFVTLEKKSINQFEKFRKWFIFQDSYYQNFQ